MKQRDWGQMAKRLAACMAFLALLAALLTVVERLLMEVNADRTAVAHEIPLSSADVVFAGSSHVYGAIIPQKLMDDLGIASVNAASGNQRLWHSAYEVEWIFQRQKPKVIVLDLFSLGVVPRGMEEDEDAKYDQSYYSFLGLVPRAIPWTNPLKYSALVRETLLDPYAPPYLTTIGVRHDNLWEVNRLDFIKARGGSISSLTFNYFYLDAVYTEMPEAAQPDLTARLPEFSRQQLLRIHQLCKQNGASLLLIALPQGTDPQWLGMLKAAEALAREEGIGFLSMQTIVEGSGFDFATDMADIGHMNYDGAQKVTDFFGQYLKDNYALPDRREDNDPRYDRWKERPYQYEAFAAGSYIKHVKELDEWVNEAGRLNQDYLIIIATNQAYGEVTENNLYSDIFELLRMLGLEQLSDFVDEAGGYFALLEGTEVREDRVVHGDLDYAAMIDGHPLTVRTKNGQDLQVKLDNTIINCGDTGLNIIVYSKVEDKVIMATCVDLTGDGILLGH